ncbi:MAG: hypothetical protein NTW14_03375 [bacterium]|nr:hypothetical protein [bacterium]
MKSPTFTRAQTIIAQELDVLLAQSMPTALSSPLFGNPTIHDFVNGLILSSNIIDVIKKHLARNLEVDWGQIIDENGNTFSKECDIIIYKPMAHKLFDNRTMRYALVYKNDVKVVIQVKSSISSVSKDDRDYCKQLMKFNKNLWYFVDHCIARNSERLKKIESDLCTCGYKMFIYLEAKNESLEQISIGYKPFIKFIEKIKKLR